MPERIAVVYFSQTGNTESVARAIARGLESSGAAVDLLRLESTDPATLRQYDFVGIGTPVFYFRLPFNVAWFLKALGGMDGRHAFGFLTDGGHPGNTMRELQRRLARRGLTMVDGYRCLGYDTYPPFIGTNRKAGHPDAAELAAAEAFGRGLAARRDRIQAGAKDLLPVFPRERGRYALLGAVLSKPVVKFMSPRRNVNAQKCTRCGLCAKSCPTQTITLDPTPKFGNRCVWCTWCERVCPVHAIECDWTRMKKRIAKSMEKEEHEVH
jgi:ferredoxin